MMAVRKKKYVLTPDHRGQLGPWADRWIANAMSTRPMDESDREAMRVAVAGLYEAAGLRQPKHVVFVPSPLVLAFAGSFAAGVWHVSQHGLPGAATLDATRAATLAATRDATYAATLAATRAATYDATTDATPLDPYARFLLDCCRWYYRMWDGGNQWSAWCSYLSFFRHVAKLDLPEYDRWQHYENAAIHGGPRVMHPDFCMISDRPEVLLVDDQNRPHCDSGPSHRWRDGWELWFVHGVRVDERIVMRPESLTADEILAEQNAEVRRVMLERAGFDRVLDRMGLVDSGSWTNMEGVSETATLYRLDLADDEPLMVVRVECPSTGRVYLLRVDPDAYGGLSGEGAARAAVASTWRQTDGSMVFASPDGYVLAAAT